MFKETIYQTTLTQQHCNGYCTALEIADVN